MSTYDDSSLFLYPSGYKASVLFAQKPMDANGQLAFTRSNDTATRVASNGLIEKVRTNLVLQSNTFNTTWSTSSATITGGQAGYDGTNNAWLLGATANSGYISQAIAASVLHTESVYAKAGTLGWVLLLTSGGGNAYFNLTTGALGSSSGILSAKIESVGGGWYRCSISQTSTTTTFRIYPAAGDGNLNSSGGNILIQNAQIETGDIATDYIATTTTAVSVGPLANIPRIDYLGGGCGKLLLEPQRTNVALYSQQLDDGVINKLNTTVTANNATSPDGTQNADLIIETTTNGIHVCGYDKASITSGTTYTASVFLKKTTGSPDWMQVAYSTTGLAGFANFNLSTGAVGNVISGGSAKIENYGNGWYRCSLTQTANATGTGGGPIIVFTNNTNPNQRYVSYAGSTSVSILAWGLQLEAGSYASSYIPTFGASVTRGADSCSKTGISSLIGQTEGTVFVEVDYSTLSGLDMFLSIRPNASNKVEVYRDGGTIYGEITAGSSFALSASKAVGTHKIAFAYKSGSSALYIDGVLAGQSTTAFTYSATLADLFINQRSGGTFIEAANYKQAILFKNRLPNSELASLTTL